MGTKVASNHVSGISKTAVIGAGVMGHGIAQVFAHRGCGVALYDISDGLLVAAMEKIRSNLALYAEMGLEKEGFAEAVLSRITTTTDLAAAVAGADFVTEAVLEDAELKKRIFREIEKAAPDGVIVASNTSTMPLKQIGETVVGKERLIITQWFQPAPPRPRRRGDKGGVDLGRDVQCDGCFPHGDGQRAGARPQAATRLFGEPHTDGDVQGSDGPSGRRRGERRGHR